MAKNFNPKPEEKVIFESLTELAEHVRGNRGKRRKYGDRSTDGGTGWYGGQTFEGAITMAADGGLWQEGLDTMPAVNIAHETLTAGEIVTPTIENGLHGFAPNVAGFCAGTPDTMMHFDDTDVTEKRLLRVGVQVAVASGVEKHEMLNRGAAIMAVLDQLSREGYHIELWALGRSMTDGATASMEVCLKHAHDLWSPASISYALCHVGFFRRLGFNVFEHMPDASARITQYSYGDGGLLKDMTFPDFDISFGYVYPGKGIEPHLRSIEAATAYVKQDVIAQLNKLVNPTTEAA